MDLSLTKISSTSQCDKIINELEYNKKGHEWRKTGLELRAGTYLKRYNKLKSQTSSEEEDIQALEIAINAVPDGNIKNQLEAQLMRAKYKLIVLKVRLAKMDLCKVVIWQSLAGQQAAMLDSCIESLSLLYAHRQFLQSFDIHAGLVENLSKIPLMPVFYEEILNLGEPSMSNAGFLAPAEAMPKSNENNMGLRVVFKEQIRIGNKEMAFFQ